MDIKQTITDEMCLVMEKTQGVKLALPLADSAVLLETGLDSIGFAILVASLEEKLGYDPFQLMDEPYYPSTFVEFVAVYEKYSPKNA